MENHEEGLTQEKPKLEESVCAERAEAVGA